VHPRTKQDNEDSNDVTFKDRQRQMNLGVLPYQGRKSHENQLQNIEQG
jgi:hypothetical protein